MASDKIGEDPRGRDEVHVGGASCMGLVRL